MLEPLTCTKSVAQCELLVVDDQQAQLKSLQQLLHISGYPNVTLASGGDEAIRILQNSTPQLILLDLLMPGTNGLDVIAFHHQAGLDSEIIVISGEISFPWVKEAMRLGAFDFICKPYKPEELLITIVKALDRFQEKKNILEWRNNTPKDINSHLVGVLAMGQDITDRKKEEEEIRRFKIMTDNAVYAKAMTDLEGKLVYVNQFFADIHGYSPAELIGQNTSIFHSADQLEHVTRRTIQLRQDGYFLPCEVWHVHRHGTEFPMLMSAVVLKDDQGNPQYLATSAIDITERKQMENAIKAARNQLQATLNALPDLLFEVDSEGRIFSYHSPCSDLLAAPPEVFLDKRFADVLPQEATDACQRAIDEAAQSGSSYGETYRLILPQGEHWFELSVAPLHGDDQSGQRFIMISRDITERIRAEEELQSEKAFLKAIIDSIPVMITRFDPHVNVLHVNKEFERTIGWKTDELKNINLMEEAYPDPAYRQSAQEYMEKAVIEWQEFSVRAKSGENVISEWSNICLDDGTRIGIGIDVTRRKQTETYREMNREILQTLNQSNKLQETIQGVLTTIKIWTKVDAVGLRLQEGEDFPYLAEDGFPANFLLAENTLIERGMNGGVCRDKDGNVCLAGTCGLVLSGQTDSANPLFTQGGSFWTNDFFPLLDLPSDQDPRLHPRNNCIHEGYASVALIPIRTKDRIVGLLQLNDKRKDRFTLETINMLEDIAAHIGSALMRRRAEEAMRESEERFKALHNASFGGIAIHDQGVILDCNQGLSEISGFKYDELIGMDGLLLIAEQSRETVRNNIRSGYEKPYEVFGLRKNGQEYPLRLDAKNIPYNGKMVRVVEFRDITVRKKAEIALHDAEQKAQYQLSFHRIAAETAAALATATSDTEFDTDINQCLQRLGLLFGADRSYVFQFSDDLAYTTNTHEWCADGIAPEMDNLQNLPMDDKSWLTTRLLRDGVVYARVADLPPEAAALKAEFQRQEVQSFLHATTRGAQGKLAGFIGFDSVLKERSWRDDELDMIQTIAGVVGSLSVSKQSEKKLRASHKQLQAKNSLLDSLSKTDQLTGIANRRRTQQVIEQEIDRFNRYKKPFCIFLFDIDHFKAVNDNHGHEVGDQVLVELVGLVQSVIRRTDTLGRWGGEEFILVCPETSLPTAQTIAEKICTAVREYEFTRGLGITLSIGVSEIQSGATLKEILVEVDRKMYLAKQKGRDRVEA